MVRESIARKSAIGQERKERPKLRSFSGGPPSFVSQAPPVDNARLGLLIFLAAETMFFAGLIGAFLVFRLGSVPWPPPFQPRLPIAVTGVNTIILLLSGVTVQLALRAIRSGNQPGLTWFLSATALLGLVFLGIQGYEWIRLIRFGLTMSSGVYGATFYTLIGCHALHVLGAVVWLGVVLALARGGRFSAERSTGVQLCAIYWTFVVALWPVLYGLVYLY